MAIIKRAWRNLRRATGRTALLTAVVAVVSMLSVIGLTVQAGTKSGIDSVRLGLGSDVRLTINMATYRDSMRKQFQQGGGTSGTGSVTRVQPDPIAETQADALAKLAHVVSSDKIQQTQATSSSLTPVTNDAQQQQDNGQTGNFPGGAFARRNGLSGFRVVGDSDANLISDFRAGSRQLTTGRLYTADEVAAGTPVAIVDDLLAQQDNLTVGSTISLQATTASGTGTPVTFTVIGIAKDVSNSSSAQTTFEPLSSSNTIYVPYTAAQDLSGVTDTVSSALYVLDDPANIDAFRAAATAAGLDTTKFSLDANDAQFQAMAGPLQQLDRFSQTGIIAVMVVGAIIVALIMTVTTRERKLEIGLLRSLGAPRAQVALQFLAETMTICLIAVVIGSLAGMAVSQTAANYLLSHQVAADQSARSARIMFAGPGGRGLGNYASAVAAAAPTLTVNFGWTQLLALAGVGIGLALIGSLASVYWITKLEPTAILAGRS